MENMRILVVDDHDLFRDGIVSLLNVRGYQVVGEARDGLEAMVRARELKPDLILMDIRMPNMGGLEATRLIKTEMPEIKVVILTMSDEEEDLFSAIKSGAQGYLLKNLKSDVFFELISGVANNEAPISPRMAAMMLQDFSIHTQEPASNETQMGLTDREKEVLQLLAEGKANKEISSELVISESTVKFHLRNILDKLHLENRAQVIAYASRRGYGESRDS